MSRASEGALDTLHAAVAEVLLKGLTTVTVDVFDKDGNKTGTKDLEPTPQMIAQAIKFLQANGIDAPARSKRLTDLAAALDDLDVDEAAVEMRH